MDKVWYFYNMNDYCPDCGQSIGLKPAIPRIKRWVVRKLAEAPEGLTKRELMLKCAGRDRRYLEQAVIEALQDRLIFMREGRLASATAYELDERFHVLARIAIGTAPWFGFCQPCGRELGLQGPELVGRLLEDEPCNGKWLCSEHLAEKLRDR